MGFLKNAKDKIFGASVTELTVQEAGVADELAAAGKAFGTLMESVGVAVAESQRELDGNSADIASLMSNEKVELIRAKSTEYDDDGNVKGIAVITGEGRLIELASPVFYEHKFVSLQGEFRAKELSTSSATKSKSFGVSGNISVGKQVGKKGKKSTVGASGGVSVGGGTSYSESGTSYDESVGSMRMNALIAPKDFMTIPKPKYILDGPKIVINAGSPVSQPNGSRETTVKITLYSRNGTTELAGKSLMIDTDGISWEYFPVTSTVTSSAGIVEIKLTRYTQLPATGQTAAPLELKRIAFGVRYGLITIAQSIDT